jgi:hypothetical protein
LLVKPEQLTKNAENVETRLPSAQLLQILLLAAVYFFPDNLLLAKLSKNFSMFERNFD